MAFLFGAFLAIQQAEEEAWHQERIERRMLRDTENPFSIEDRKFVKTFHLNKEACHFVIRKVSPRMNDGLYSNRVPVHLRVLCSLHFVAAGSYQRNIGNNHWASLSQSMVSKSLKEFCSALIQTCLTQLIQFPRNNDKREDLKLKFFQKHQIHNIIGIIDCTQISIVKPRLPTLEWPYVNEKGYHSINVQIICDADTNILNVAARWPGSTPDAFVWKNSSVARTMRADYESGDESNAIMGDSGYPCLPWLFVPVPQPETAQEEAYNDMFKRAHSTVERTIGILKGRFRCLLKDRTLHYTPLKACHIILACSILHNIARKYRVEEPEPQLDEIDLDPPVPASTEFDAVYQQRGEATRQRYIVQHF